MRAVEIVLGAGWAAFWLYWLLAALGTKRGRISWGRELRIRLVLAAVVVGATRLGAFRGHHLHSDPAREAIGLALWAAGLAFAIWARLAIGRNWGTPMSRKREPELVTSGPYRLVRHPIYSGIVLAAVATALALSWWWLVVAGLAGIYFLYSATVEERYLAEEFPAAFPAYRRRTKMLVPFVL